MNIIEAVESLKQGKAAGKRAVSNFCKWRLNAGNAGIAFR